MGESNLVLLSNPLFLRTIPIRIIRYSLTMQLRVSLMIIALAGTANATGTAPSQSTRKRLQWEHFWNTVENTATDIGDVFVDLGDLDVPMDQVFKGVWSDA